MTLGLIPFTEAPGLVCFRVSVKMEMKQGKIRTFPKHLLFARLNSLPTLAHLLLTETHDQISDRHRCSYFTLEENRDTGTACPAWDRALRRLQG